MFLHSPCFVTLALFAAMATAEESLPPGAERALVEYTAAFHSYDCHATLKLASPALLKQLDKRQGGRSAYCEFLEGLKQDRVTCEPGKVIATRAFQQYRFAVVENFCNAQMPSMHPSISTGGAYVIHSADAGRTWYVLDQMCDRKELLKDVYPGYAGDPPIPDDRLFIPPWYAR